MWGMYAPLTSCCNAALVFMCFSPGRWFINMNVFITAFCCGYFSIWDKRILNIYLSVYLSKRSIYSFLEAIRFKLPSVCELSGIHVKLSPVILKVAMWVLLWRKETTAHNSLKWHRFLYLKFELSWCFFSCTCVNWQVGCWLANSPGWANMQVWCCKGWDTYRIIAWLVHMVFTF